MGTNNIIFLEVIEWFDPDGSEVAHRIPEEGSGEIKFGAQLVVRESQVAVFFYNGKAIQVFGPGRHTLKTGNIPVLTKLMSIPWGMTSPLRAEVYFCNMKVFANQKWGTRDPVAFKDSELGLIRLRAFGHFNFRIIQPLLFVNFLVGTVASFGTADISDYLSNLIVSRFNDYMGENLDSLLSLPAQYDEMGEGLLSKIQHDFASFGLSLHQLLINSITPPPEVQKAIDDRSKLGVFDNLDQLTKMKTAMAIEKAADNPGGAGEGMGMGLGFMMPGMLSQHFQPAQPKSATQQCPDCRQAIALDARFCPLCGHQILVFDKCANCGKNLQPSAQFCSRCGEKAARTTSKKHCSACGAEALADAKFCNRCGEQL
ncbi:MAG: zinc-ribbon domain-containing protein [Chitinivibrionales bacterium]|nr:zinc-ribbon domain-containing protein [Chitinivibrionales bacterium]